MIRGSQAYLPNIAASPDGPLRFDVSTQAFLNTINGIRTGQERDGAPARFLNLHLGARDPEPGKKKLFFANVWAIGFTNQSGAGFGYVVSAGSDLLVKIRVAADGRIAFTNDADTTRYIDLNNPADPATAGANAGKNPQGIVVNAAGTRAYVANFVSRNVSVVDLRTDRVIRAIQTSPPATTGTIGQVISTGAEMFFSSRGNFDRPATAAVSTSERLSTNGWQSCSSCHFKGLTDGVVWEFAVRAAQVRAAQRDVQPAQPDAAADPQLLRDLRRGRRLRGEHPQRLRARPAAGARPVQRAPARDEHARPRARAADRRQRRRQQPAVRPQRLRQAERRAPAAHDRRRPGARRAARVGPRRRPDPERPPPRSRTRPGPLASDVAAGRSLFQAQGCQTCHGGQTFTISVKDFVSPPAAAEIATETTPPATTGNPVAVQYLPRFLRDIGSFDLGVAGGGNDIGADVGAVEKAAATLAGGVAQPQQDALGRDYNGDGKGNGYNVPSLARHQRRAALLPQRRVRDARLRRRQSEAPDGERPPSRPPDVGPRPRAARRLASDGHRRDRTGPLASIRWPTTNARTAADGARRPNAR